MKIQESAENYLETIYILKNQNGAVRSIDIAQRLEVTKPSVSRAMSLLRNNGYILMEKDGWITLTDAGLAIARDMYERHQLLTNMLTGMGVSPGTAATDACRIEHVVSRETFEKVREFVRKTMPEAIPEKER